VNFHNAHVWVNENPHTTVAWSHQHRFSINVLVGILGDQLLGLVVLRNRITGAIYHRFFWRPMHQYSWNMSLFINDNTCGSCMVGHHLIFSPLSDSTEPAFWWTVDRMQRSIQLPLILWTLSYGDT
jgi:hypothetical protein